MTVGFGDVSFGLVGRGFGSCDVCSVFVELVLLDMLGWSWSWTLRARAVQEQLQLPEDLVERQRT